jgi:4-hydroxy-tetrahydrodipicolinate synthase
MKYVKREAKEYAQERMTGIWAAVPTPFDAQLRVDETGFEANLRHWVDALEVDGLFIGGKQGEYFSLSVHERKRLFAMAVDNQLHARRRSGVILSCSDQNLDVVLDLAAYAEAVGGDYIVVHSPMLHFGKDIDSTVYEYYRYISERTNIGIAMWSHPDAGYLMSPELCMRIAEDCPNVVAIKYSVPRDMYVRLSRMSAGRLIVSTASEGEWLDNMIELNWKLYLCSIPPILYQTATDKRIRQYTDLALRGDFAAARQVRDSLEPVRAALHASRPAGTPQAQQKYWQELLGQTGGPVRRPLLNLSDAQKSIIRAAFDSGGLGVQKTPGAAAC